ncbi:MAG: hypothetical protein CK424_01785 [Legionella sp.]|nr:MAG: hypothetical protein CK424_01785 [Legionella sp.]
MSVKFFSLSALALAFAVAHAPAAVACPKMDKEDWMVKVTEKLDLTTAQKAKIKIYAEKAKMELTVKHHEWREIHNQVNEAFRSSSINEAKVDEFANQEEKVIGSMAKIRLHERYDIYSTLDDKQKEKMNQIIKDWKEKHHKG